MAYLNLLRGSTTKLYLGLDQKNLEANGAYSNHYTGVRFGIGTVKREGKFVSYDSELEKGDILQFVANCGNLKPIKYKVQIEVNPQLRDWGFISAPSLLEEGDSTPVIIQLMLNKNVKLEKLVKELDHLVRLYLVD